MIGHISSKWDSDTAEESAWYAPTRLACLSTGQEGSKTW